MSASPPKPEAAEAAKTAEAGAAAAPSGIKAMLPLIIAVVLMPGLAYAMTTFVLLPKLQKSLGAPAAAAGAAEAEPAAEGHGKPAAAEHGKPEAGEHGKPAEGGHGKTGKEGSGGKGKVTVPMKERVLVNVAGTMGTRYLVANFTLVGANSELKHLVDESEAQLRDVASSVMANKSIADLERPGARNLIRTELISAFNTTLGNGMVQEIYFTEFAVQ